MRFDLRVGAGVLFLALASCAPRAENLAAGPGPHTAAPATTNAGAASAVSLAAPPAPQSIAPQLIAPQSIPAELPRNQVAPLCKIDGCCAGHGDVAYVQRDYAVICTDGSASEICDCHT